MNLSQALKNPVIIGIAGVVVVGGVGLLVYKLISGGFKAVADINKGTPYEGAGVAGTLGNVTNQVLGGAPQTIGEAIGGGLYSIFGSNPDVSSVTYIVNFPDGMRHAVDSAQVDGNGNFIFNGSRYTLTDRNGAHYAFKA